MTSYKRETYTNMQTFRCTLALTQTHTDVQGDRAAADLKLSVESTLVRQVTLLYFSLLALLVLIFRNPLAGCATCKIQFKQPLAGSEKQNKNLCPGALLLLSRDSGPSLVTPHTSTCFHTRDYGIKTKAFRTA